jgi:hypothetical protein
MRFDYDTKPDVSERKVRGAFRRSGNRKRKERYQFTWEHAQWWVTEMGTGRTWAVAVVAFGKGSGDDFDFDLITEGDER